MCLCGCVRSCARPDLDSKQMKKGAKPAGV